MPARRRAAAPPRNRVGLASAGLPCEPSCAASVPGRTEHRAIVTRDPSTQDDPAAKRTFAVLPARHGSVLLAVTICEALSVARCPREADRRNRPACSCTDFAVPRARPLRPRRSGSSTPAQNGCGGRRPTRTSPRRSGNPANAIAGPRTSPVRRSRHDWSPRLRGGRRRSGRRTSRCAGTPSAGSRHGPAGPAGRRCPGRPPPAHG